MVRSFRSCFIKNAPHCASARRRKHVLMFEHNVQDVVKTLSAEKLQGLWRMRKARQYIKAVIVGRFSKRMKRSTGKWYYIDPNSPNR